MKKLAAIFIAFALVFSSVGSVVLFGDETTAEAKSYKSGKKGFNSNNYNNNSGTTNNNMKDKNSDSNTVNKSTSTNKSADTTKKGGFFSGGLMKGLFIGGLAGLLFGSLFSDMGLLGNLLGFMINAAAIIFVVFICMKIFQMLKRNKEKEVTDNWRR